MPVKIIAIPGDHPGLAGRGLASTASALAAGAPSRGHHPIAGYASIEALFGAIAQHLQAESDCLEVLEIQAHGDATVCDGIGLTDGAAPDLRRGVATVAALLTALPLCDRVDVYLSGCNTGLPGIGAPAGTRSVAEQLADALPTFSPAYPHRITVHGARGYFGGTHMGGNARSAPIVWGKLAPRSADYPPFDDAMVATGSGSWRPFTNGW